MNANVLLRTVLLPLGLIAVMPGLSAQPVSEFKLVPADSTYFQSFGVSVAVDGDVAVIGAPLDSPQGIYCAGAAYVFVRGAGGWTEQAKLVASDPAEYSWFGSAVAVSGNTIAVAARYHDWNTGAVYVFTRTDTGWSPATKVEPAEPPIAREFGCSVAIEGDTLVVGAPSDPPIGAAFVFVRDGATWTQQSKLVSESLVPGDVFGFAVAIRGNTVAVGAPYANTASAVDAGAVEVFVRDGAAWSHQAHLIAADAGANAALGWSVALGADTVLAGAPQQADSGPGTGAAYLFARSGNDWTAAGRLSAETPAENELFGSAVALRGDRAVASAPLAHTAPLSYNGELSVFTRSSSGWERSMTVRPADNADQDQFGSAVALSGTTLLAGTPFQDVDLGYDNGAAYVFALASAAPPNAPPVADASATVTEVLSENRVDAAVTLDGSNSSDPDGNALSFVWSEDGAALGDGAVLTVQLPVGTHSITLTVSDGVASASTAVSVQVVPVNHPPVADAGATAVEVPATDRDGADVVLDGSLSSDPDGDALTFEWFEGGAPLASGSPASARLAVGTHTVTLVVSDGALSTTNIVTVAVVVRNHPPVAQAGPAERTIISPNNKNARVQLDGSESSDPDGDALTCRWWNGNSQIATGAKACVTLPVGSTTLTLRVSDGQATASDNVTVRVITAASATQRLIERVKQSRLEKQRERTLLVFLQAARESFERGHMLHGVCNLLVFERLIDHRGGKPVDPATARKLAGEAQKIIDAVSAKCMSERAPGKR